MSSVTALITTFNEEKIIRRSIKSILSQDIENLELLVVDDGSNDNTVKVVSNLADNRLKLLQPGRIGRASALKHGTRESTHKYIAILDADDEALKGRLDKQSEFLDSHPDHAWVGAGEEIFDKRRNEFYERKYPQEDHKIRKMAARSIPYSHSAVMFRRSIVNEGLNYDPEQPFLIDFEFFIRVAQKYKVANLPDTLVRRHVRSDSFFQSKFSQSKQNVRLAQLSSKAIQAFDLPLYHYIFPLLRLGYPYIPTKIKQWVRRLLGLKEKPISH